MVCAVNSLAFGGGGQATDTTLLAGFAIGVGIFAASSAGLWTLHFSVNIGVSFAASVLVFLFVSRRIASASRNSSIDRA